LLPGYVVHLAKGRQPHADTVQTPDFADGLHHLNQKARPALDRPVIRVGPQVGARTDELVDEVAVGTVHLDAV
jgi:hypothetical protein